jgi:hypothetical protein
VVPRIPKDNHGNPAQTHARPPRRSPRPAGVHATLGARAPPTGALVRRVLRGVRESPPGCALLRVETSRPTAVGGVLLLLPRRRRVSRVHMRQHARAHRLWLVLHDRLRLHARDRLRARHRRADVGRTLQPRRHARACALPRLPGKEGATVRRALVRWLRADARDPCRYVAAQILGGYVSCLLVYVQWHELIKVRTPDCLRHALTLRSANGGDTQGERHIRRCSLHALRTRGHRGAVRRARHKPRLCLRQRARRGACHARGVNTGVLTAEQDFFIAMTIWTTLDQTNLHAPPAAGPWLVAFA